MYIGALCILALKGSAIVLPFHILFDMVRRRNVSRIAQILTRLHLSKCSQRIGALELVSQASKTDNIFNAEFCHPLI